MEIKKYVLLDNIIYGKSINEFGNYYLKDIKPNDYCGLMRGGCNITYHEFITTYNEEDFKTSDNILDLVEVGDLVEIDNDWEILKVLRFNKYNEMVCMVRTSSTTEDYTLASYRKQWIKAIYKLQPNGDYKRYEVEE